MARVLGKRVHEEEGCLVNHLCLEVMVSGTSGMYIASICLMILMRETTHVQKKFLFKAYRFVVSSVKRPTTIPYDDD